jgi:outer membrane biosynthesis protein TonB
MDDEFSWALPEGIEGSEESHSPPPARARLAPPPATREEVLAQVKPARSAVYEMVRTCVDDFETTAPWKLLYYPPEEPEAFVDFLDALLALIQGIPKRVAATLSKIPKGTGESDDEPTREDVRFMFSGIHHMVEHDLNRVDKTLAPVRERMAATPDERQLLCELSADLKGKYASSMMGAAASLIAQGLWNGVALEPILFPEKAEEFRNTRELVDLLKEVTTIIKQLPDQVHFTELVSGWQRGVRADQYALADLPSLRGKIAKLLKERTRRALYSGDYHQISRREILLSERINELETLHQKTWSATEHGGGQDLAPTYARLVQLTLEMAAILDVTILKELIGDKKVEGLRARVTIAKTRPAPTASTPGQGLDSLIPLLAEDDLRIFLELLLGAVMRRASLSVAMRGPEPEPAPAPPPPSPPPPAAKPKPPKPEPKAAPAPEPVPKMDEWMLPPPIPDYDASVASAPAWVAPEPKPSPIPQPTAETWTSSTTMDWLQNEPEPPSSSPSPPPPSSFIPGMDAGAAARTNLRPALKAVSDLLNELLASANPNLSSFRMTQRLLSKHARIPAAMFQSIQPYLKEIQERLLPALKEITPFRGITDEAVKKLEGYCVELRRPNLSPAELKDEVPKKMDRLVRFLEALRAAVPVL